MTALQKKSENPIAHLSAEDIEIIGKELDTIRQEVRDSLGADDATYIRTIIDVQRKLELGSRAALLASMFPPAWVVGTVGLSLAKRPASSCRPDAAWASASAASSRCARARSATCATARSPPRRPVTASSSRPA